MVQSIVVGCKIDKATGWSRGTMREVSFDVEVWGDKYRTRLYSLEARRESTDPVSADSLSLLASISLACFRASTTAPQSCRTARTVWEVPPKLTYNTGIRSEDLGQSCVLTTERAWSAIVKHVQYLYSVSE